MHARDVLRRKGSSVVTVPPGTSVADLLARLAEHNIGAVLVSADGDNFSGIVSERDVVRALTTRGAALLEAPVEEIMTHDLEVAAPSDSLDRIMALMTEHRIRHVPVLDGSQLVGIISIGDVVKSRMDELETEREQLIGYISSSR